MQTKQQIEKLLASAGVSPNKRFGQHFLIDLNLMRLLLGAAHIQKNDVVLEAGCGTGSFTEGLAEAAGRVISVEIDNTLAEIAKRQLKKLENVQVINADILENKNTLCRNALEAVEEAKSAFNGQVLLVANLPYNIAAPLMMILSVGGPKALIVDSMCVTVQKEVGQRMVAHPGSKEYGPLSIYLTATGKPEILRKLKPAVFWPKPQIDSVMVRFIRDHELAERIHNEMIFREVVNLFMGHRRKMLQGCVKFASGNLDKVHNWSDIFTRAFVESHSRPEELSADDYISIANLCCEQITEIKE